MILPTPTPSPRPDTAEDDYEFEDFDEEDWKVMEEVEELVREGL